MSASKFIYTPAHLVASLSCSRTEQPKFVTTSSNLLTNTLSLYVINGTNQSVEEPKLLNSVQHDEKIIDIKISKIYDQFVFIDKICNFHFLSLSQVENNFSFDSKVSINHASVISAEAMCCAEFRNDIDRYMLATADGKISLVNNQSNVHVEREFQSSGPVMSIVPLSETNYLSGNFNGQLFLWDIRDPSSKSAVKKSFIYPRESCSILSISSHSGQPHLAAVGLSNGIVSIWDVRKWGDNHCIVDSIQNPPATLCHLTTPNGGPVWKVKFNCDTALGGRHNNGCLLLSADDIGLLLYQNSDWSDKSLTKEKHDLELLVDVPHLTAFDVSDYAIVAASQSSFLYSSSYVF